MAKTAIAPPTASVNALAAQIGRHPKSIGYAMNATNCEKCALRHTKLLDATGYR